MNQYEELVFQQNEFYRSHLTKKTAFRVEYLRKLRQAILKYENEIIDALEKDLGKSAHEAISTEIGVTLSEIAFLEKQIQKMVKPKRVKSNIINFGATAYTIHEPYGTVLIIAPWNYPFQLAMSPVVGAIAAGNTVILKPSEYSAYTSGILKKILSETFEQNYVAVVNGGVEETTALLENRFDQIFFTGSPAVGKIIMKAAAKYLTPVVLELGGKSPCIVDKDVDLNLVARRIIFGKAMNSGQTCVAPDYLILHKSIRKEFYECFSRELAKIYGDDLLNNSDFGKIINEKNFDRILSYLQDGEIISGGGHSREELHIDVTLIEVTDSDAPILREEIFGPVLPVITFETTDDIEAIVARNPDPLALYLFSENRSFTDSIVDRIHFGGGCINDTLMHITNEHLPFGGRGTSGIGRYHGKHSFETFTHEKAILRSPTWFDLPLKYPHVAKKYTHWVKKLLYK